jgi:5-methylcytosine-specific restriction endonuclease McrA
VDIFDSDGSPLLKYSKWRVNMVDSNEGNKVITERHPAVDEPTSKDSREQRWEWRRKRREARHRDGRHTPIAGIVLIAIGVLVILGLTDWWPIILIGVGIAILLSFFW